MPDSQDHSYPHAQHHSDEPAISESLRRDLRALHAGAVRVPELVDARILARARRELGVGPSRRIGPRWWIGISAAAACAALATFFALPSSNPQSPLKAAGRSASSLTGTPGEASELPEAESAAFDINGDGTLDMLDAYMLARGIASDAEVSTLPAAWDASGDGVIDQRDVDRIAYAAVSLDLIPAFGRTQ